MGLTNARDTTVTRLRVQPIDERHDDDLFAESLYPSLMAPVALTFAGIYSATVSTQLVLAAATAGTLILDAAAALASGTYLALPYSGAPAGLVFANVLSVAAGKIEIAVVNATSAQITVNAATALKFLVLRIDTVNE